METKKGDLINAVLQALKEHGPGTVSELAEAMDECRVRVNTALCTLQRNKKTKGKRVYISSWKKIQTKAGARYFKVFQLGNKNNAGKPKPQTTVERDRRYRENLKLRQTNSVFNLGLRFEDHFALRKKIIQARVSPNAQEQDNV